MSLEVRVKLKNHSYIHVAADAGILVELRQHFSFRPKGFEWSPKFKSGQWDGYIRLFDARSNTMYAGLYSLLAEFVQQRGYKLVPEFTTYYGWPETQIDVSGFMDWVKDLKLISKGKPIEPHDYQINATVEALIDRRGVALLPTGSGKSLVMYLLARYVIEHRLIRDDQYICLIVPTVNLVKQMYTDFEDYSSINGWPVNELCQQIYAGQEKEIHRRIVISTWQSLQNFPAIFFKKIGMILGDEAHHFKADVLTRIMTSCNEASYRVAMTGTLDGDKINALVLQGLFGRIKRYATTKELQDRGLLAPLKIGVVVLKYGEDLSKVYSKAKYEDEIAFIVNHEPRNKFIVEMALGLTGNTLVMFKQIDHGKKLHEMLKNKMHPDRKLSLIYGGIPADDREAIRKIIDQEKNSINVVSVGTFAEGANAKNINNLISVAPGKSRIKVLQAIGRTLRVDENGTPSLLVDIGDNFCYRSRKNHTFRHLEERIKMYIEEEFEYSVCEIKL